MYHVSTLLPHMDYNEQQLHKKRHIGNDIVLVVFQEEGAPPFIPSTVKSNYIQIIIVVRSIIPENDQDNSYYRVTICAHGDVPEFGPPIPYPPIFKHGPEFGEWIISKMINAELAAYRGKLFRQQIMRDHFKTSLTEISEKVAKRRRSLFKSIT
eukprot:TRINITY_DN2765_c0_g1_i1.p1 TRINITY_DN2765_c0_g1~~TRINITY_DN2765_c0_g1_i1.p1  ORF type:complete len:154 (+),score=32.21 TRINITY_DN2765_c0_g1_i1:2-463(+)